MSLGERLKKAREESGLTIKKFADLSKIPLRCLENIEGGNYEKLPAFVYVQGFLKKYAQILNLSFEELIAQHDKELGIMKDLRKKQALELPSLPALRIIVTPKRIKWAVIFLAVLAVGGYLIYQLDFLIEPPKLVVKYPDQDIAIERASVEILGESDV
jgi:cytoskeletal protein RodZ